jgi:hypothetical protein
MKCHWARNHSNRLFEALQYKGKFMTEFVSQRIEMTWHVAALLVL